MFYMLKEDERNEDCSIRFFSCFETAQKAMDEEYENYPIEDENNDYKGIGEDCATIRLVDGYAISWHIEEVPKKGEDE